MTSPPGAGWGGQRRLLRKLKAIMAGSGSAQARLDQIVAAIAAEMVAEVCSAYVMRRGDVLELFATVGLNKDAVRRTRLRVGEGLVGEIARSKRPLALPDARSHPSFAYRPETGEDKVSSLLGAPLLRGEKVLGVLVVQNRSHRRYDEEEVEALETIAMVLAELAATGELFQDAAAAVDALSPIRRLGVKLHGGFAIGQAALLRPRVLVRRVVSDDTETEALRLEEGLARMRADLETLAAKVDPEMGETANILSAFRMFADDKGWRRRLNDAVLTGLTAEAAVERVRQDTAQRMRLAQDPYIRDRLSDLEDLALRLLRHLDQTAHPEGPAAEAPAGEDLVLFARTLGPADLLEQDRARIRAIVLEESGPAAHVALIARALDIPTVGAVGDVLDDVVPGDPVIVDADRGGVMVRPTEQAWRAAEQAMALRETLGDARGDDAPTLSRDGRRVEILLNVGLRADFDALDRTGAEGVGLYRTEIAFMTHGGFPDRAAQRRMYANAYDAAGDRPMVFRALDVGGDKALPYWQPLPEENPAMGWRAARLLLDRPAILRGQIRAMMEAAAGRPLSVMLPMIASVAEFRAARGVIDREYLHARAFGVTPPETLQVGAMLEVPALLFQIDAIAAEADFLAMGSNDLCQFLFAADRGSPRMAGRFDPLSAPFFNVVAHVVEACARADTPLSVCGELAGRPLEAMALIGLGVRRLSMGPAAVGPVRAMVRSLNVEPLTGLMAEYRKRGEASLRGDLAAYARDRGVMV